MYFALSMMELTIIEWIDGKYVPFGVFALYNDSCLRNSLEACMTVVLQLPSYQVSVLNSWLFIIIIETTKVK